MYFLQSSIGTRGHEIHVLHHEVCHSHQYVAAQEAGTREGGWLATPEGRAFDAAWTALKTERPDVYASWIAGHANDDPGLFEDFAEVCAAWYYPFRQQEIFASGPIRDFAVKWLPK